MIEARGQITIDAVKDGNGIKSIAKHYAVSTSNSTAPTSWSTTVPALTATNKYLWNYETITYTNGSAVDTTKRVIGVYGDKGDTGATGPQGPKGDRGEQGIQGLQGIQGPKGDQGIQGPKGNTGAQGIAGKTSYFHVKYSNVANPTTASQMNETGGDYIGTYVDFTEADSTDPKKYTWVRTKGAQGATGAQGIAGKNGTDGKTSYLHIAYANSADGKTGFDVGNSTGKLYIGQYVDFTEADSTDPTKYSWTKIKGEQGVKGDQGQTGDKGEKGDQGPKGDKGDTPPMFSLNATSGNNDIGNNSHISFNGKMLATSVSRGHTIYFLRGGVSPSVVFAKSYDTYGTPSLATDLATYLTSNDANAYNDCVLVIIGFDALTVNNDLRNALKSYGYGGDNLLYNVSSNRTSFVFIGQKGMTEGTAYYKMSKTSKVSLTASVSNGVLVGTGHKGDKGDRGEKGDQGPRGLQGLQGPKGDTGVQGPKGATGATGSSAEFDRLAVANEKTIVSSEGVLEIDLAYKIEHVKGSTVTSLNTSSGYTVRYRGNTGTPANTNLSSGLQPSVKYSMSDYYTNAKRPSAIIVELLKGSTVVDMRSVPVVYDSYAATTTNKKLGSITTTVAGHTDTLNRQANKLTQLEVGLKGVKSSVQTMEGNLTKYSTIEQTDSKVSIAVGEADRGDINILQGTAFTSIDSIAHTRNNTILTSYASVSLNNGSLSWGNRNVLIIHTGGLTKVQHEGWKQFVPFENDTDYTLSVYAKRVGTLDADGCGYIEIISYDADFTHPVWLKTQAIQTPNDDEWRQQIVNFHTRTDKALVCVFMYVHQNGELCFYQPMLTRGHYEKNPPKWTPSPYDTIADTMKPTGIDGEKGEIHLHAGKTYVGDGNTYPITFSSDGKISATSVQANEIVTKALTSNTIKATNATIDNLTMTNANISGSLYSTSGTIGGYKIGTDYMQTTNIDGDPSKEFYMSAKRYICYHAKNKFVGFGLNTLSSITTLTALERVEDTEDISKEYKRKYGAIFDISGAAVSVKGASANVAISVEHGVFEGFRRKIRRVDSDYTISTNDCIIITVNNNKITLTLPSNPEDGQEYHILKGSTDNVYIHNPDGTELTRLNGDRHNRSMKMWMLYDKVNNKWIITYFNEIY